ncbi:Gcd10p-domain-containing protein [Cantharellus anzutake]|uniref:Gcd10p-domain-containing protein n=1 Tax=Cantharellus anzutake TaxID=1750568 RepID=UPI00190705EC|nr:Gcd10p-domain-containing protein [Cantharellus anzutake]KAF8314352.1 Gcd10p-domain-containing protein [Cantharellus anzutake]
MDPGPSKQRVIGEGDMVLLQTPSGETRHAKVERKATINIGKFGNFPSSELVGKWPGFSYDIVSHKLHILPPRTIEELEDTNANNELINDGSFVQPLTHPEIEELKRSGASFTEIWKRQTEQHANYELKTEYSKEKYKKRKEAKFAKRVTIIEPTIFNVCDYWFTRDPSRVRDMRPDTLSQIISMANVQSGSRIIIVDDTGGLILAAALDRMGGSGTVVAISDSSQAPSYPCISSMNFSPEQLKPLSTLLNWVHVDEEWAPMTYESPEAAALHRKFERDNARIIKRREAFLALQAHREDLFSGEWDALLISSNHEPHSIIEKLAPYLAGSSSIIVHSPYVHVLTEAQVKLRADPQYLGSSITEGWLRRYQILPGRTHPTMQTSGSGGYLLQTIKVYVRSSRGTPRFVWTPIHVPLQVSR